ncbi:translocation/assembly module TamB domain-containing protein [Salinispira pacifica]|uniref:Translocation and assembly module TamB C-terminal domain-containing protein n=1 Tax=Salinispira pacifica TaxID=1307761 RepID=V5WHB6_9SPIO|nr:translocation/assembly module TamB domain-containing protein [Salinispira pacifica]AHC15198.1 hypothetical protein L21SP2_1823 [Salinispira pacifica]
MKAEYRIIAVLQITVVVLLILLTLLVFYPVQQQLSQRVGVLKNEILLFIEESLGNNIEFSSIHPSIFSYIEIRNLRVYDDNNVTLLTIDRLIFRYDIREVLRGNALAAPQTVEVRGGDIYLHRLIPPGDDSPAVTRDNSPPSAADEQDNPAPFLDGLNMPLNEVTQFLSRISRELTLNVRNLAVEYRMEDTESIQTGSLQSRNRISSGFIRLDDREISVDLTTVSELDIPSPEETFRFNGVSEIRGTAIVPPRLRRQGLSPVMPRGEDTLGDILRDTQLQMFISTRDVQSELFRIQPLEFYLGLEQGEAVFRSLEGSQPFGLEFRHIISSEYVDISFNAAEWTPANVLNLNAGDPVYNRLLGSVISAGISFRLGTSIAASSGEGWLEMTGYAPILDEVGNLSTDLNFENRRLLVNKLEYQSASGNALTLSGFVQDRPLMFQASGRLNAANLLDAPAFSTAFTMNYDNSRLNGELSSTDIRNLKIGNTQFSARVEDQRIFADLRSGLSSGMGSIEFSGSSKLVDNSIQIDESDFNLRINDIPLRESMEAAVTLSNESRTSLQLPDPLDGAVIQGSIQGSSSVKGKERNLIVQTRNFLIRKTEVPSSQPVPPHFLDVTAVFKNGELRIPVIQLNYESLALELAGTGDFRSPDRYVLDMESRLNGFPYSFAVNYNPDSGNADLKGSYSSSAQFLAGDEISKLQLKVGNVPLENLGEQAGAYMEADFEIDMNNPSTSRIDIRRLGMNRIMILPIAGDEGSTLELSAQGSISQGLEISALSYSDIVSSLSGGGSISTDVGSGSVSADVVLENQLETYRFSGVLNSGNIRGRAELNNFPTRRLGLVDISGLIAAEASVSGSLSSPVLDFQARSLNTRLNNDSLRFLIQGQLDSRSISLTSSSLEVTSLGLGNLQASYDFDDTTLNVAGDLLLNDSSGNKEVFQYLESRISLPRAMDVIRGETDQAIQLSDLWREARGELRLTAPSVSTSALSGESGPQAPQVWSFVLQEESEDLQVRGGPREASDAVNGSLNRDGSFSIVFSDPLPVQFEGEGFFTNSNIDMNLNNMQIALRDLLVNDPESFIGVNSATAEGALRVTGSIVDPDFYGTIIAKDVEAELDIIPGAVLAESIFVILEGKSLFFPEIPVQAGDGTARLSGSLSMDRWVPDELLLDISTSSEGIPISYDFSSVVVDGWGNGDVQIGLNLGTGGLSINGAVEANATGITLSSFAEDESQDQTNENPLDIDLKITAGRGVEFFWPSRNFPILRSTALSGEGIRLQLSSPPYEMSLVGDVPLRGGEIFYFEQNFYVRQGRIRFNENEEQFNPLLSLNAEVRGTDENGPVRIYLEIVEDTLSELQPRFTSDPSKSEPEIIALLGGRVAGNNPDNEILISDAVLSGSEILGQVGVFKEIEDEIRSRFNLDLFSLRTGLFQNLLEDVIVTPGAEYPLNNSPVSLGKYLQNTTLLVGKYIGDEVFLEAMAQLQEQSPLDRPVNDLVGLEVDLEVSLEWITPFFNLTWSFAPENPESLWVTDHTLTFTRDFFPGSGQ